MWWARATRHQLSLRLSEHWLGTTSAFWWSFVWSFSVAHEGKIKRRKRERKKETDRQKSPPCLPEMFGAILGDPWVAGLRWCAFFVAPDHWLFLCGQMWWELLDRGRFLLGCNSQGGESIRRFLTANWNTSNMALTRRNKPLETLHNCEG